MDLLQQMQAMLASRGGADPAHMMSLGISPADVHVDQMLSNLAIGYENQDLIADKVLPVLPVRKRSDRYWIFDKESRFNTAKVDIASQRGRPNEVNVALSSGSYSVKDYGLMGFVPFDMEANADAPLDPGMLETETITSFLMLAREVRVAALFNTTVFAGATTALSGTARWDDYTNSDPAAAVETYLDVPMIRPNTLILGVKVYRALRSHPKFQAYIQGRASYVGGATPLRPTMQQIAEAFDVANVIVPRAKLNAAVDGAAMSLGYIWPQDMAAFIHVEPRPNPRRTSAFGYTMRFAPPGGNSFEVINWFDRLPGVRGGTYYKCTHSDAEQIIAGSDAGYLLTTVVS